MLLKNLPKKQLIKIPLRMVFDLAAAFLFWKHQGFGHFKAVWKAELDFILNLRKYWRNRSQHAYPKISLEHPIESVALQYFFFNKKTYRELNQ